MHGNIGEEVFKEVKNFFIKAYDSQYNDSFTQPQTNELFTQPQTNELLTQLLSNDNLNLNRLYNFENSIRHFVPNFTTNTTPYRIPPIEERNYRIIFHSDDSIQISFKNNNLLIEEKFIIIAESLIRERIKGGIINNNTLVTAYCDYEPYTKIVNNIVINGKYHSKIINFSTCTLDEDKNNKDQNILKIYMKKLITNKL